MTSHASRLAYTLLVESLNKGEFKIPNNQDGFTYFPDFLKAKLDRCVDYFDQSMKGTIDQDILSKSEWIDSLIGITNDLSNALVKTVEYYYNGNLSSATETFFRALGDTFFDIISPITTIETNSNFYRARQSEDNHLKSTDLFHIPFEKRHLVSTNRYSIPGFPALYLGDSTFVCWEEFDRPLFSNVWFSRLTNTQQLRVIKLRFLDDLLLEMDNANVDYYQRITSLGQYLLLFPLTWACTIRTKETKGSFKPEYIIPQLLLQYVSQKEDIDGIQYPSTKVDYQKLHKVHAYNYVFPVKTTGKDGHCKRLTSIFQITDPTTLNLEHTIHNPSSGGYTYFREEEENPEVYIEFFEDHKSSYITTSFGKLESQLKTRKAKHLH